MKRIYLLVIILVIAAVLRFYQLGSNPPSLTWDEVAWGYNAYSLGIDGKDEFGHFLPYAYFESFGDYKPPVYAYLDSIPVKLFGLNEFAVRFPSALFGTLTVLLTYFLVKEIFLKTSEESVNRKVSKSESQQDEKTSWRFEFSEYVALMAALIMAVSPWNIMLSRAAFEANVASFFIVFGVWSFLYAMRKKSWLLILSVISFVLCEYTFNSTRVVAPLLLLVMALGHSKPLLKMRKFTVSAILVGALLILPLIPFLLSPQARLRYQEVNIFTDSNVVLTSNQEIANAHNAWWAKLVDNRRVGYSEDFLKHYFDNFSPMFLFIKGDANPKFSTQDVGQMYLWDLPFFVLGILFLFRQRKGKWWIIPLWLVIGIIPAAVARETPHALRTESTLPTWQIFTAYGFVTVLLAIKQYQKVIVSGLLIILFLFAGYYLHGYYSHYPKEYSGEWQYGYKQSITYIQSQQQKYDKIVVTPSLGRPYIYYLFYLHVPPSQYLSEAKIKRDVFGFVTVNSFGKYIFGNADAKPNGQKVLYIQSPQDVPPHATLLKTFTLLDGSPVLVAYTK